MGKRQPFFVMKIFVLLAISLTGCNAITDDSDIDSGNKISQDLAGKIVEIQTKTKRTLVLENVKVVKVEGHLFLSGTGVKDYAELWWEEMPIRVRFSQIVSYSPMTPEQFDKSGKKRVSDTP